MSTDVVETQQPAENATETSLVKHYLQHEWTMWCLCNPPSHGGGNKKKVQAQNTVVYDFNTVEDFWAMFNSLKKPTEMESSARTNIIFSRKGMKPEWEDKSNKPGGEWISEFEVETRSEGKLDKVWDSSLLGIVGGEMPFSDDVTCIWLSIRPKRVDKIQIWMNNCEEKNCMDLAEFWVKLHSEAGIKEPAVGFITHADNIKSTAGKKAPEAVAKFTAGTGTFRGKK